MRLSKDLSNFLPTQRHVPHFTETGVVAAAAELDPPDALNWIATVATATASEETAVMVTEIAVIATRGMTEKRGPVSRRRLRNRSHR